MAAMRVSICIGIAMAIWFIFNVNHGYYIPMTVMIIYAPFKFDLISARLKSRLLGVFLGVLYGVLLLQLLKLNENVILIIPLLAVFCLYYLPRNYMFAAMIITMAVVVMFGLTGQQGQSPFSYGIARVNDTLIASVICMFCELIFVTQNYIQGGVFYRLGQIIKAQRYSFKEFLNHIDDANNDQPKDKLSCLEIDAVKQSVLRNSQKLIGVNAELGEVSVEAINTISVQIKLIKYLAHTEKAFMRKFKSEYSAVFDDIYHSFEDIDYYAKIKEPLNAILAKVGYKNDCSLESILATALGKISDQLEVLYNVKYELINAESKASH
jgi:uncharacterized membrane protein YgaE (UPF0421/DUF939 family)